MWAGCGDAVGGGPDRGILRAQLGDGLGGLV